MRKRQPQQLFKTKCHRGISFASSWPVRVCFSHSPSHFAQECGLGRLAVGGRTGGREAVGGQAGRSCQVSACPPSPRSSSRTRPLDPFIHQAHPLEIDWAGLGLHSPGPGGGGPGRVTIKGSRDETPGEAQGGTLAVPLRFGHPTGPPGASPQAGGGSSGRGRHASAPLTARREVWSPAPCAGATPGPPLPRGPRTRSRHGSGRGQPIPRRPALPARRVT